MNPKISGLMADAVRRVLRGAVKRPTRQGAPSCESLEGRVVLSNWGGADLLGGLSQIGVVTTVLDAGGPRGGLTLSTPAAGQTSQTDTDWQTLQTKIQGLAAKSAVTVADLSALASDSQAIATAGGGLKAESLKTVLGNLATAVAGGADTAQAQTDFNALFSGSKVDQATIDKTFTDLVQTIKDSKITTTDLTDFATAQAALPISGIPMNGPGFAVAPGGFQGAGPQGDALTVSLANAGVVALPAGQQSTAARPSGPADGSQLQTDLEKLRSDLKTVTAKSSVTSDDLVQLKTDFQDITTAGLKIDPKSLQTTINGLVAAVAGGVDTTQAKSDFNALFSGSSVSQTVIDKTFTDLVQTIQDSNITSDDATLIASDQAAVQAAFDALPQGGSGGGFTGPGGPGGFATITQGGSGGGFVRQGGGMVRPDGQSGFAISSRGGPGGVLVAQGVGMAGGQGTSRDPGTVTSGNPGAPTSVDSGSATIIPASTSSPVASTAVNDPGTSTVNAYAIPAAVSDSGGGRARGGLRGHFVRSLGGRFGRNATGASQGGVQDLASGMARQGRVMSRFRGR